ncbi:MAG TPA: SUMF1/EgtB/PvdO family nonheme iron enzyme, partial [Nitrospiria bacterium]|nr:SUMF1/EgtB/PvdO family nonheme iron enzyme [Nitrospiria bacterium]
MMSPANQSTILKSSLTLCLLGWIVSFTSGVFAAGDMVEIPAGVFLMGEGEDQKEAFLDRFWMDRFEVTNAEYQMAVSNHEFPPGRERHPVNR